jgi:hypothetical protein
MKHIFFYTFAIVAAASASVLKRGENKEYDCLITCHELKQKLTSQCPTDIFLDYLACDNKAFDQYDVCMDECQNQTE